MATCPVPHVADALDSYIKPRAEVLAIRQNLQTHLERHVRLENNQPLSSANIASPPVSQTLPDPPSSITGVRKAYYRALRAHQAAQARYEALRSDITAFSSPADARRDDSTSAATDLLPLLRLREKQRRLRVLGCAVEGVEAEGAGSVDAKLDDLVRERVGEAPVPISADRVSKGWADGMGGGSHVEGRMAELKRAVLRASAGVENGKVVGNGSGDEDAELFALQQARNDLIGWIERQLALIGDAQAESESVPPTPGSTERLGRPVSNDEIAQLYEKYLDARQELLHTVRSPPQTFPHADPPLSPERSRSSLHDKTTESAEASATVLLPHIKPLLAAKVEEQSLGQQQTYLRRQLAVAEANTERLARRLADESHLVHPGVSRGRDWADAATEAAEVTRKYVEVRARGGEEAAKEAEVALNAIVRVPETFRQLESM